MTLNKKHCLLFLAIFVILIMGVTALSATEVKNTNITQEVDNKQLSTPNNDVDKMVQSSVTTSNLDAKVKNNQTSDNTNKLNTTKQETQTTNNTSNNDITSKNIIKQSITQELKTDGELTFTELNQEIQNALNNGLTSVTLQNTYKYNPDIDADYVNGITISTGTTTFTINSNANTIIDGNHLARIFNITRSNVIINNITFINAYSDEDGGAIIWKGTNGTIIKSNFYNNSAKYRGGAIYFTEKIGDEKCANINITDSIFIDNNAGLNGGAVDWGVGAYNATISYSNFTNNIANRSAGAIYFSGKDAHVYHSYFANNQAKGTTMSDSRLEEDPYPVGPGNGGAILWRGENGIIENSTFYNNSAYKNEEFYRLYGRNDTGNGGAVFLVESKNVTIRTSHFINNTAERNGGAVDFRQGASDGRIEDSTFDNNTAERNAGAVFWDGDNGTITNSNFTNNQAKGSLTGQTEDLDTWGGDGGAIMWTGCNGTIFNSNFKENEAAYRGGAIYFTHHEDERCENITVTDCNFTSNHAGLNGGAVDWGVGAYNATISSSRFISNIAERNGGALYVSGREVHIRNNSYFEDNKALGIIDIDNRDQLSDFDTHPYGIYSIGGGYGGAILWTASTEASADGYINNTKFYNNEAVVSGGAVFLIHSINVTVANSNFTSNHAGLRGGALNFREGAENCSVRNSIFEENNAESDAGAIYWNGEKGIITNSNFTNNKALGNVKGQNTTTLETYGGDGGAVLWTGSNGNISNSNFENNEAAYRGGAIYFTHQEGEHCENITVANSNFTSNHAGLNGGAVDWGVGAYNATISSSRFISNIAERNGGALYVSGREVHILNSSYFEDNQAKGSVDKDDRDTISTGPYGIYHIGGGYGGAILWTASTEASADGIINNTTFLDNEAVVSGGAVFLIHSINVTVDNSNFTSNYAGLRGGALNFREGAENCSVRNSIFEENTARTNAGAIYWNGPNGIIEGSTFNNNNATLGHGGAVMWTGSNGYVGNTTFTNNYAKIMGGAVRVESANNDTFNNTHFENNTAGSETESNGGAIAVGNYANDTVIANSSFDNNKVIGTNQYNSQAREYWDYGSGGAVFFGPNGDGGLIYNSTFFNNSAYANAGAVNWNGKNGQIILSTFTNNTAEKRNGGAVLWEGNVGNITDSKFYNNSAVYAGGALRISGNDIRVNDTLFDNNHDATNTNSWGSAIYITGNRTDISYSNFTKNIGALYAGAVYVNGENATLNHNIFLDNNATAGGSVYINGNNTVLNNSVFNNSKAIGNGSAVTVLGNNATIMNSEFNNNSLPGEGTIYIAGDNAKVLYTNITNNTANYGGAIYVTGDDEIISQCNFDNNTVKYQGGAIYSAGEDVNLSYSSFINNTAPDRGGAIYWAGQHDYDTITTCDFINNSARDGGAIYWTAGSAYGNIIDCNFDNNTASNNGAAIHMTGFHNGIIRNSNFNNNTAGVGGAIYGMQSDTHVKNITVINSTFIGNNATTGSGGAIYYQYSEETTFIDSYFENNTAKGSGGAVILNENCDNATFENCTFINSISYATGGNGGGAIYFRTISDVRINNSQFINNTVPDGEFGGAFYLSNGNNYIIANSTFTNNSCNRWGGAFIILYGNNHEIDNCTFLDNHAREVGGAILYIGYNGTISNSEFNNNSAQEGGAVYSGGISGRIANYIPSIYNSTFTNNTASNGRGGAIVLDATNSDYNATLFNNSFTDNYAKTNGGAAHINSNNVTATNITATNNEAGSYGGAIYWGNMNGTLENSIFADNNASYGGALSISGTTNITSLKNVTFINNTATNNGGAINVASNNQNGETLFEDLILEANKANDGGAVYSSAYNLVLSNDTIKDNIATRGGALYLRNELTQIVNSNISNNNATTGSAIFAASGSKINIEDSILLENQAHSRDFNSFGKNMANKKISGRFRGNDNYMNAIYVDNGNNIVISVENTTYLTKGGINNSDTITPYYWDIQEVHQNITMEVYDPDKNLVRTVSTYTTVSGNNWGYFEFNLTDEEAINAQYSFKVYHPENNYYTYYANSISGTLVNVNVASENITYLDDETIDITVTSRKDSGIPTGNVTVTINNTMGYDNITFDGEDVKILENGHVQITIPGLNASEYTVYVYYNGDETYIPDTNSSNFTVSKAASFTDIGIENYTYNNTMNITFNVTNRLSDEITGKVLVNITGIETDGTEYALYDVEVNITMDEEGNIVNNTFELPILNAGNYTVVAYYNGSNNYNTSNATRNFTVYKAASVINVTASNVTSDEGSLVNIHVEPEISTGEVTVIVYNDPSTPQYYESLIITLTNSGAFKQLNELPAGTYHVLVQYPGDKNHNSSTNSTTFTVTNPTYPIGIQVNNMTYGQSQLINITVPKDTQTDNLVIKLNDTVLTYTMSEEGVIVIDTSSLTGIVSDGLLVVGEYKVNVTYTSSEDDKYPNNSTEVVFNVLKAEPEVTVNPMNISYGFNETININITSYNASGKVNITIFNESGNIYTNSSVILANNATESQGIELVLNSTIMIPGNFTVKVEYYDDTNYNESVVTADFQVASPVINIEADRPNIYVGEFVTLLGTVTDGYGHILTDGIVNITVYDNMGNLYKNYTVSLNENGIYKANRQYLDNGTYTANATYYFNDKEIVTSDITSFVVNKIPTNTTVRIINNTYGNVLIDVVVVENATDYTGNVISGKINVTINDETVQYDIKGANTTINITGQVTTTGRIDVGVIYNGSFKYINSTGMNISDTDKVFDHIDVVPMASNLTISVNESVKINQTVTITGQVYDEYGNIIQNGKVNISVNGLDGQIVDIIDGRYTLTDNNTTSNTTVKVKVTYLGQEIDGKTIITQSINETTFNVEKWPTNTTVKVLNSTVGNVTIDVQIVTDNETANPIKTGVLNISIAGNDYIEYPFDITETPDNNITIKLPEITTIGNIPVKVVYNGSEVYIESNGMDLEGNEFKNITVTRQDVNITVAANVTETFIGQHVNITGNLTNAMGQVIKDTQVLLNITGMNNLIPVWTNSTGGYTYDYIAETIGEILVNATYTDTTNVYNNSTDTTTFKVTKIPTKTNITIVNNTIGNVIIHVNVTNQTNEPVTIGHVKVYDNTTGLLIGEGDLVNGGQDITLNVTTPGKLYINATYQENDIYYASNATDSSKTPGSPDENTTEINVVKQNATITINIVENNVTIGDKVVIYGVVTDGMGKLIPTGNITILINGTMHNTTLTNGEYRLDNITDKAGLFHVNATFTGNDNVSSITSRTINFTVNKIPTITTINIINTTAGHVQIEVSVTNNTGLPVSMGNITVEYSNGTFITNKTLENGKANITIISSGIKTLDVNVTYNENTHYMTSNATTSIEVTKNNATITISLNTTNLTIRESVNITGIVKDEMGSIITENVTVTVDNVEYEAIFLENGTYTVTNVTTKAGTFTVNATYTGNDDINTITSENVNYTVNKIPTTTIVDIMNNTVGNVTINVAITNATNDPITIGNFNITVAGKTTTVKVEGINTTIKLNITQADDISVSVKYIENDIYMESNGINNATIPTGGKPEEGEVLENITTIKQAANLTVNANPSQVIIGESVTITGVLKDGMNNTINDEFITITLNGDKYYTTTNNNGEYSITNVTIKEGVVNVTAYYKGNSTVNNQTAYTNFTVNKIPTTTLVNITNTTVGNVNIDVIIIDDKNKTVTNGKLNITIQYNTITVDVTGEVTPVKLNITTTGLVNVTVEYLENEVYLNSTGLDMESYIKDPENADTFNNITVTKINTTITIEEIEPVKAGNSTIIQGKLVDEQGQPINGADVVIQVDNQKVGNVTTNQDGLYTLKLNETIVGTHNVTSTYGGNNTYIGSEATTTFEVEKIDTQISINPIEEVPVGQEVTITGILIDEFQEPIKETEINVTFDGQTQTVTTDKEGNYEAKFPTTSVGEKPVNVEFPGSDIYNNATSQSIATINKITGKINVEVPENATVNTPVNITGNVTDEEGNPIPNLPVNVTVNNETIPVITDENGTFTVPTNNTVAGTNNVTVTAGNDTVETEPVKDTFNANKIDTIVTINKIDETTIGNNATITGTLTDIEAKPIPNANISITINGTKINTTTDNEGNYEISYPTTSIGTIPVLVEYKGNETYNPSNAAEVLTVVKQTGIINVEIPENITPGTTINITGNVTDEEGNPIPNLPVNVTVNNETIPVVTDENGTFTVPTNNTVPGTNNVTVTAGNDTVETEPVKDTFNVRKIDTHITINPTSDVIVDEPVNITGTLTDENNNPIPGAQVTVTVDGIPQTVTTGNDGKYTATFPTSNVGEKPVTAKYLGNDKYNGAKTEDIINVVKNNGTISLELPSDAKVGEPTNITGKITDMDGNPVPNMPVNITVNNKTYPTITDNNGNFQIEADNVMLGTNNVTATSGNEKMNIPEETGKFNATKKDAKLTVDPIADAKIGDTPEITGKLVDEQDNPIAYTPVTITVNDKTYTVITDEEGNYELTVPEVVLGLNNVTVSLESNEYDAPSLNTSFEASKINTIVTVPSITGIVGEDITLTAYVTDEDGNPVTGGNLVFKLNGRTLRIDGRFDTNDTEPWKFKVVNGIVTFTMKADLYLRSGKNITASYSGSYKYEAAKGNVAEANIKKRNAQIEVSVTPNPAKQNTDIVFTATLTDITPNATNKTCLTTDAYVIFKINGKTLKDDNNTLKVKADHSVVNYVYHVPTGTGGVDENGLKNYTVEAVYDNPVFYPDTRNTSVYHVDRSIVNINFIKTSVSNDVLSVKATFTDYENNYLVGDNKICVKINGITYKENGETKYFTVHDGKVDLTGIKLSSGTAVKSVMLVTGDRQAYLGSRATTTDITTN